MFFVILLFFVVLGSFLTIITVQNLDSSVALNVFSWQTPLLPLGLVVILSFLLGALLLYVVSLLSAWRDGRQMKRLRERIAQLEQATMGGVVVAPLPDGNITSVPMPGLPPAMPETDTLPPPQLQG